DAVFLDRVRHRLRLAFALVGERLQRGDGHEIAIDLEEVAQLGARVGAAEAVGAEHTVAAVFRDEGTDLVGKGFDVVGRCNDRSGRTLVEALGDVGDARLGLRMQHVPAIGREAVAAQLGEARRAPYIGRDAPVFFEQLSRRLDLAQYR